MTEVAGRGICQAIPPVPAAPPAMAVAGGMGVGYDT
jgi:hypothetical protein